MGSTNVECETNDVSMENVEDEELQQFKNSMQKLYSIWEDFGLEPSQKSQRAKVVWNHLHSLLQEIVDEEINFYEDVKERIQNYSAKLMELSKLLSVSCKEVSGSLIKKEELLRQELDSLTKLKNKRVKAYQDLKKEEMIYCQMLNLNERQLPSTAGVPSERDLEELRQHIILLKDEKQRRHAKFCNLKRELTTILETTELTPESVIEKDILSQKENFSLSNETVKALEAALSKAQAKKAELETVKTGLIDRLSNLWKRLKVEENKRMEFLSQHADCRLSTIKAIEQELEKCEKLKRDNIKMFVESLKEELNQLWVKCHASEEQKREFEFHSSQELTDDTLAAFDVEVEKWKKYYGEIRSILDKIDKRRELFDLIIEFENKANDPNRFKNRRGNLLQEEKQRKKLQRDLPALENEIFHDIEVYENEKGMPFFYDGEDYRAFVTRQWEARIAQKENEKLEKQKRHYNNLQSEVSVGTPLKRPLLTTPKSAPSKLFKSNMLTPHTPTTCHSKLVPSTVGKLSTRSIRQNNSRPNAIKMKDQMILRERNRITKSKLEKVSPNSTTYTQFANELNTTARCSSRSSVLSTKKPGGTRISITNRNKRKSASKSLYKSPKNSSKTTPTLTPARGKCGLPFII